MTATAPTKLGYWINDADNHFELARLLGDTSRIGTGRGTIPKEDGKPDLAVVSNFPAHPGEAEVDGDA
jgi:hypothetical protein